MGTTRQEITTSPVSEAGGQPSLTDQANAEEGAERVLPLAEQCAEQLRSQILTGELRPGQRLRELALAEPLGVSRNTLREAFRLLAHDRLVQHQANRGVFVRRIDADEARAIYAARRHIELGVLQDLAADRAEQDARTTSRTISLEARAELAAAVEQAQQARQRGDWEAVGTANARFHLAVTALGGNPVIQRMMRSLMSQTHLRFLSLGSPQTVHQAFVNENLRIANLLLDGHFGRAHAVLENYLLRAEQELTNS